MFWFIYGRFLVTSTASTTPTIAMAMITAAIAGMKYWSVVEVTVCVGVTVGATGSTAKAVEACDGQ